MRCFLLTSTIDILCLLYSLRNLNKLSIKYQPYPKSTKINAFNQNIMITLVIFSSPSRESIFSIAFPYFSKKKHWRMVIKTIPLSMVENSNFNS